MKQLSQFPVIETSRLVLDKITQQDIQAVYDIFSNHSVTEHYDVETFTTLSDANNMIQFFDSKFDCGDGIRWAIRDKKTNVLIGSCGFNLWSQFDYSAIVGYELNPTYWGMGYASEAIVAITNFVFNANFPFYINRIEASVAPENTPSRTLLEKLGFVLEGELREKSYWGNQFHNMCLYSLLHSDWTSKK